MTELLRLVFLVGLVLSWWIVSSEENCVSLSYRHPYTDKFSPMEIVSGKKSFCLTYPRCLVTDCCDVQVTAHVQEVHSLFHCDNFAPFQCMMPGSTDHCNYNESIVSRLKKVSLMQETLTTDMLYAKLLTLPPTPVALFEALERRCEFKVLYLIQGDDLASVDLSLMAQIPEHIFLNYKKQEEGSLYYPKSDLSVGRLALYLAGRELERSQGWLYDYFVFMDDDPVIERGTFQYFERFLHDWRPAIGAPSYFRYPIKDKSISPTIHIDHIIIANHREAVEIMMQWLMDQNKQCNHAPQFAQILVSGMIYRNHILVAPEFKVQNPKHREYHRSCLGAGGFQDVITMLRESTSGLLTRCVALSKSDIPQGGRFGRVHPKLLPYHLIFNQSKALLPTHTQSLCNMEASAFGSNDPRCCSVDSGLYAHAASRINDDNRMEGVIVEIISMSKERVGFYFLLDRHAYPVTTQMLLDIGLTPTAPSIPKLQQTQLEWSHYRVIDPRKHCLRGQK